MRGNIISVYSFRILMEGLTLESLEQEFKSKRMTKSEYEYLIGFYNRNILSA